MLLLRKDSVAIPYSLRKGITFWSAQANYKIIKGSLILLIITLRNTCQSVPPLIPVFLEVNSYNTGLKWFQHV